jgi:MYXO-CTERM domain-containing protein
MLARSTMLLVLGSLTAGCSAPPRENFAQARTALVGAAESPAGGEDDAVLMLRAIQTGETLCTATLVAPNLVITTRHCVAEQGPPPFECTPLGELIPNGHGGGTLGLDFVPSNIEFYGESTPRTEPLALGAKVFSTFTETICKNDIAFVLLDRALDRPVRKLRLGAKTEVDERLELVGYGLTSTGAAFDYATQARRRLEGERVVEVGPDSVEQGVQFAPPRTFVISGPASCYGDSGGPAIADETNAVMGVFSTIGGSDCTTEGIALYYTQTGPFQALAEEAFEAAGHSPLPEHDAPPDAGGSPDAESDEPEGGCSIGSGPVPRGGVFAALALVLAARRRRRNEA